MAVDDIKGFLVVPLVFNSNKYLKSDSKTITHYTYIKKHQASNKNSIDQLAERSLFIINPPLNTKYQDLKAFFKSVSNESILENVFVNDEALDYEINLTKLTSELYDNEKDNSDLKLPNGTCLAVFVDKNAANQAMNNLKKYVKNKEYYVWNQNGVHSSSNFTNAFRNQVQDLEELSEKVSKSLQDFEERELDMASNLKNQKSIVDEDGFTLVVGKNRKTKKGILGKIDGATKHYTEEIKKRNDKLQKKDFYRFQIRERKKTEMNELLKKFRDDQERIKQLKERKRFRPY